MHLPHLQSLKAYEYKIQKQICDTECIENQYISFIVFDTYYRCSDKYPKVEREYVSHSVSDKIKHTIIPFS